MDNWYHAIFDMGGHLGPSSFVKVDKWDHVIFDMVERLGPSFILLIYWRYTYTGLKICCIILLMLCYQI